MSYLVVQILLLLALAALCGGLLAYWLLRRRFIDVTDEYEQFIRASAGQGAPLAERLEELEGAVAAIRMTDLGLVAARLDELGCAVGALSRFDAVIDRLHTVDLGPLVDRIDRLQQQLDSLGAHLERQATPAPPPATPPHTDNRRNLLQRASFGPPDDLKSIRGIGPVLGRLLHRLGVFYFWQIAEWTEDDVAFVDDRLDVFKGRIERDGWVKQAARRVHEPDAAKPPSPSTDAATQGEYSAFAP